MRDETRPQRKGWALAAAAIVTFAFFGLFAAAWIVFYRDVVASRRYDVTAPACLASGNAARALRIAQTASERDPIDVRAAALYAKALVATGQGGRAVTEYQRLLKISERRNPKYNPDKPGLELREIPTERPYFYPEARLELAKRKITARDRRGALAEAELAQAYGQTVPAEYRAFLFDLYTSAGVWSRAFMFRDAAVKSPDGLSADGAIAFARCYAAAGAWADCRAAAELALRGQDAAEAHWWLGAALLATDQAALAVTEFENAARAGHPHAPFLLAVARELLGGSANLAQDFLATPPESLYRPYALYKACRLLEGQMTPADAGLAETLNAASCELDDCFNRLGPLPRPFVPEETPVHPIGAALESDVAAQGLPALTRVLWRDERAVNVSTDTTLLFDPKNPLQPCLQRGRASLELRFVANMVPPAVLAGAPPNPGLPSGWPELYVLPEKSGPRKSFSVNGENGRASLRVTNDDASQVVGAASVFVPVLEGRFYYVAMRCQSSGANLFAGCEWYDAEERRVYEHSAFNRTVVPEAAWRTEYYRCVAESAFLRIAVGIYRSAGSADFENLLVFPLDPPPKS